MKLLLPSGQSKEKLNPSANLKMTGFILRMAGIIVVVIQLGENMTLVASSQIDSMFQVTLRLFTDDAKMW